MSWFENLPKDEQPPEHIWEDPQGLEQWWERVEAKRSDGLPMSAGRSSEDDSQGPELVENELARVLKE